MFAKQLPKDAPMSPAALEKWVLNVSPYRPLILMDSENALYISAVDSLNVINCILSSLRSKSSWILLTLY